MTARHADHPAVSFYSATEVSVDLSEFDSSSESNRDTSRTRVVRALGKAFGQDVSLGGMDGAILAASVPMTTAELAEFKRGLEEPAKRLLSRFSATY